MEFTGKEVADAIRAACDHFHVARENLSIEVLETGSSGIFGLIRKKARIRAELRSDRLETEITAAMPAFSEPSTEPLTEPFTEPPTESPAGLSGKARANDAAIATAEETVSPESQAMVRDILSKMLHLMGMPSTVESSVDGLLVTCIITGPFEQELVGQDGRVIDSLQYFLRKISARTCSEPLRIAVNVGDFRERRLEQLRAMAERLAGEVRQSGKTRIIPALSPAERREIHLLLQNDPEVRSRSLGDGVFKRVLIFKPGRSSGKSGGRSAKRQPHGQPNGQSNMKTPADGD